MLAAMTTKKRSLGRRLLLWVGLFLALLVGAGWLAVVLLSKPLPKGESGARADELARGIEKAIDKEAWARTGAIKWTFRGQNRHLWDRQRNFDRVIMGENYVLCDLNKKTGVAFAKRKRVGAAMERKLLDKAYASWINDSFWLNPLVKLFDEGVTRSVVTLAADKPEGQVNGQAAGASALLITYGGGGLTPGDSYLWVLPQGSGAGGAEAALGRPLAWRMWVSIIPVKGLETSWDGWTQLATGAWVATRHQLSGTGVKLDLTDVAGAATLKDLLPGPDPFAMLVGGGDLELAPE